MIMMRRGRRVLVIVAVILLLAGVAALVGMRMIAMQRAAPVALDAADARRAREFITLLDAGDFAQAHARLAPSAQAALPLDKLRLAWTELHAQLGDRGPIGPARGEATGGKSFVAFALPFKAMTLDARVQFDDDGRVNGFRIVPAMLAAPAVADDAPYRETDATIAATADTALPGTLAVPRDGCPCPAAVLVHGSGPQDRDETIGPSKPFVDIARGLAARGVIVLRYDKRTLVHPGRFRGDYTVDDETIADARAAVAWLRAREDVDATRVFVVGHSLGALLAPRIARDTPAVAGLVLLAAPTRALHEVIPQQHAYIAALDGTVDETEAAAIRDAEARTASVRRLARGEPPAGPMPFDLPVSYWRDLAAYDVRATAAAIPQPILVLQGGRDYQVTAADDFAGWQRAFADVPRVTLRAFDALDHRFIAGDGPSTPASYLTAGHVDAGVVDAIATFIAATPARR